MGLHELMRMSIIFVTFCLNNNKKIFQQTKVQDQMASQVNSVKHLEKS